LRSFTFRFPALLPLVVVDGGIASRSSLDEDRLDRLSLLLPFICGERVCFDVLGFLFREYGFVSLWYGGASVFGFGLCVDWSGRANKNCLC